MKVTLSKGGTAEVTLPINDVQIPDVWKILERLDLDFDSPEVQSILECWHIAHDLRRTLQEIAAATACN